MLGFQLLTVGEMLRGVPTLRLLREIGGEPHRAPAEIARRQWARLTALLRHAEKNVPYYRELFRELGMTAGDIRGWSDFARIPVLTKDIVRERLEDLVRTDVPSTRLLPHRSGGSTGVPLRFYRDKISQAYSDAGLYRALMQCGFAPGDMLAYFWGGNDRHYRMPPWQLRAWSALRRMHRFDSFQAEEQAMGSWVAEWKRHDFRAIFGYASTVARFADYVLSRGIELRPVKGAFTTAEKLLPQYRQSIGRAFGCRVFDCYGSAEVQNIATECPHGKMHVNSDFVAIETVATEDPQQDDRPFILTSLTNFTMPFIRYRNEDCGVLEPARCDCGNNFPVVRLSIARISDNFLLPNGRVVHGEFFTHLMYDTEGVASFQFHQTAIGHIVLWIVPAGNSDAGRLEASIGKVVERLDALAPGRLQVEVRTTGSIPKTPGGKHRFTRSDVQLAAAPVSA